MRAALASSNLAGSDIVGLQMHGTGTPLGDPIEVGAAVPALMGDTGRTAPMMLLANKSIVGHAEPAAGNIAIISVINAWVLLCGGGTSIECKVKEAHDVLMVIQCLKTNMRFKMTVE